MTNSLSTKSENSLDSLISSWSDFHYAALKCADGKGIDGQLLSKEHFVNINGLKGSLPAFFIKEFLKRKKVNLISELQNNYKSQQEDLILICPSQKEADEIESDLNTILGDDVEIFSLKWWQTLPYRPSALGSAIFGERSGVLSKLTFKNSIKNKPRIFIFTQRSFLSPVVPPKYLKSLCLKIKKGEEKDPENLAKKLSELGYMRVPKVGLKGEFALRGEVLDLFMPNEKFATRIVFDFDEISQIKYFESDTQVSRNSINEITIYPMKELIWTDELCEKLEDLFKAANEKGIVNNFGEYDLNKKSFSSAGDFSDFADATGTSFSTSGGFSATSGGFASAKNTSAAATDGSSSTSGTSSRTTASPATSTTSSATESVASASSSENFSSESVDFDSEIKKSFSEKNIHLAFTNEAKQKAQNLISELFEKKESEGEEFFYGLLWDKTYSLLDYISEETPIFYLDYDRSLNAQQSILSEYLSSYRIARQKFPVFPPSVMLFNFENLSEKHKNSFCFRTIENAENQNSENNINLESEGSLSFFGNINYLKEQLNSLQQEKYHIYIFADNQNQALRINEIIKEFTEKKSTEIFPVEILPFSLTEGFRISSEKILVIQENGIFGRKRNTPKSVRSGTKSKAIDSFVELSPGDFVVHVNYGIGLFKGIERVKSLGTERDYIKLEYADQEFAFVPIEQVNMVQRYIGNENSKPKLDKIGSKTWNARKAKVQQKVQEIAEKLIDIYSKRQASKGFAFPKDTEWNLAFEAAFPYEDTPDQIVATQEIKSDMESLRPMDRLVCGDVGYGKTELAMRAAFKAVMGGKQVAFLAPTTILAEQHYENCLERFKNFPVHIAQLSRFISPSEQKKIIQALAQGKIDILIGTHRIIQKDVIFKDLGLLIIDEEQRFGVKDKEKLKSLKHNIDCLTLSATPIPRTLHMSLLKIRDMSLLTTPPQNRQAIETTIQAYDEKKVANAIRAEVSRGGQVFYLHNRVETLEETRHKLEQLVPEMMIDVAHGQMSSDELDDIFRRFKLGGFQVLVATTIIENGIDIPNVNTIIIDRADMYGISQLYQLRGRVGRSGKKAYAYLFYPENKSLSEVAMKRLQVISNFTELGSGFKIAMKDMEIRGAGNLLGKDQSGEVYAVGFEMYLNLLNAAIEKLTNSHWQENPEVFLELEYSGFIPNEYINDAQIKMEMYKKIAGIKNQEELDAVWNELFDRFGPIPDEVASLLSIAKIRIICNKLLISSLKEKRGEVHIEFSDIYKVNVNKIMNLIRTSGGRVKLNSQNQSELILLTKSINLKEKSDFILQELEQLA